MNSTQLFFCEIIRASDLSAKHKDILLRRMQGKTFQQIGNEFGHSRERSRQYEAQALQALHAPYRLGLSQRGFRVKIYEEPIGDGEYKKINEKDVENISIEVLPIPVRVMRALARSGIITLGDVNKRLNVLWKPKGMGPKSVKQVREALQKYYGKEIV